MGPVRAILVPGLASQRKFEQSPAFEGSSLPARFERDDVIRAGVRGGERVRVRQLKTAPSKLQPLYAQPLRLLPSDAERTVYPIHPIHPTRRDSPVSGSVNTARRTHRVVVWPSYESP